MREAGYVVEEIVEADMPSVKKRLGVPEPLSSCHTAEIDGYIVEGHVPPQAVARLLKERPKAVGLSAPGMPAGSPGMEGGGSLQAVFVRCFRGAPIWRLAGRQARLIGRGRRDELILRKAEIAGGAAACGQSGGEGRLQ